MGKRGGARIVYYYYDTSVPIYLLAAYAKAKQEDLSAHEKATFRKYVAVLKAELKARHRT
jgi:hypothetical protein